MKHFFGIIVAFMLLSGSVYGAQGKTPFNLREVMERVAHHPRIDGGKITIDGQVYQASFDGSGVILSSRDGKYSYRLPIEDRSGPYIKDGKVCYETPDGEMQFSGNRYGLKYQRMINDPGFGKYLGDLVIEAKGGGDLARPDRFMLSDALGRKVPYRVDKRDLWIAHKDLASLQFPLTLNGEFLIDTILVYVPAPCGQRIPSVAFDGTNYLVVWEDLRNLNWDIYGTRVSPLGTVLDPVGIPISTAEGYQCSPSVAYDGTNYLVVWEDYRNGSDWDIYGCRVSQSGTVLDPVGIAISTAVYGQWSPSVAFDGTNYLVVWEGYRSRSDLDIYGARVSPLGTVLDSAGIAISTAVGDQASPSVAFDGTNYFVIWRDGRSGSYDIYGARVSPLGTVLDSAGIAISTVTNDPPSIAFDGTNYLVVWGDGRNGSDWDIYGCRVSPSGSVLDPVGIPISIAEGHQHFPSIAFDGTNYLVVWGDGRHGSGDIYGTRVSPSGTVLDPAGIVMSTVAHDPSSPSVAFDGTNYLVVWEEWGCDSDIYGSWVSQEGAVLDSAGVAISTVANRQRSPSVAYDGTNYLVVWEDYRNVSDWDIYGCRVSPSGTVLDPGGIAISTLVYSQYSPSVGFDGTNYLVVWGDYRNGSFDIYGSRVSYSGTVLDSASIAISTTAHWQLYPSVGFDGTNYLVVWEYHHSGSCDIYGARVSQSGTVLDSSEIAISTAAHGRWSPSVAFDGTNYLAVWQDHRSGSDFDIYGCRVSPSGTVLDSSGIAISTAAHGQYSPSVSFDGTTCLVVWGDYRSGSYSDIYGARVSQSGEVLDSAGIPISTAEKSQESPSVAFDGTNYLAVWQDHRSGSDFDIYGARINPSGLVIDTFAVSTQPGDQVSPALARGAGTQLLIAYAGFASYPYNTRRIWGKFYPFTGVEEEPTEGPLPLRFSLEQNYPNPFNATTTIRYAIPDRDREGKPHRTTLKIYNILGQEVKTLVDEEQRAGSHRVLWDGRDSLGEEVSSGIYFCRLEVIGDRLKVEKTRKMVLIR